MDYFNKQPRLGTLSTSSKDGMVNSAYFGSPYMVDERTIIMGLTMNRTLFNLQENPNAVFMIMEPGKTMSEWTGVRIYVKMTAKMIYAALTFEVQEIRPLADFGQGWEKSI
jgi:putative heme iron utilization protein